ncbi:MAG: biotin transporter BioY [Calditrichota bacterium]
MSLLKTHETHALDRLRNGSLSWKNQSIAILLFAGITWAGAKIELFSGTVPTTLQTLGVYGSGLFLGPIFGFLSQLLYLVLGIFFPITAGDGVGLEYMATRASSGYLLAFPFVAAMVGYCSERWNTFIGTVLSIEVGSLLLFLCGVSWLSLYFADYSFADAANDGWLKFIPADQMKILLVASIYLVIRRSYNKPEKLS